MAQCCSLDLFRVGSCLLLAVGVAKQVKVQVRLGDPGLIASGPSGSLKKTKLLFCKAVNILQPSVPEPSYVSFYLIYMMYIEFIAHRC